MKCENLQYKERKNGDGENELTMQGVVSNAINKGATSDHVAEADRVEAREVEQIEGEKSGGEVNDD